MPNTASRHLDFETYRIDAALVTARHTRALARPCPESIPSVSDSRPCIRLNTTPVSASDSADVGCNTSEPE
eukprot:4416787-Pleurochrysis_carterae.AAC.1